MERWERHWESQEMPMLSQARGWKGRRKHADCLSRKIWSITIKKADIREKNVCSPITSIFSFNIVDSFLFWWHIKHWLLISFFYIIWRNIFSIFCGIYMVKPYVKGIIREDPPKARAKGRKGGQRVVIVREDPPKAHPKSIKGGQKVTKPESITIKSCPQTERLIRPLPLWWLGHKWCRSLCSQRSYSGRSF